MTQNEEELKSIHFRGRMIEILLEEIGYRKDPLDDLPENREYYTSWTFNEKYLLTLSDIELIELAANELKEQKQI